MQRTPPLAPLLLSLLATGCALGPAPARLDEPFRPQLSYSPQRNWMNDPNGLVYHEGEYHLFYQYNPNGITWGDMSWGHAVSPDLLHWTELAPALAVKKDGQGQITEMVFSGSAVVDEANTSGLGRPGQPAMVALYTSVYPQAQELANGRPVRAGTQAQSLVYSLDKGRSWHAHPDNPVLEVPPAYAAEYRDFRDPKLFWYAPERKWVMVLVLPNQRKALFYSSPDLKRWEWMSEFGPAHAVGGIWECPDLFELAVDGDPGHRKWVLVMSLNPGGPAGGSGTQYFVGDFDGKRFIQDPPAGAGDQVQWLDHGADFYAAVSYSGVPDGRRILVGWMNNWLYGQQVPTAPWRSAQSVPRELSLRTLDGRLQLVQQPIAEFARQRGAVLHHAASTTIAPGAHTLPVPASEALELELRLLPNQAREAGLRLRSGSGEQADIGYDAATKLLYVDRNGAGQHGFHKDFANRQTARASVPTDGLRLRVLVDRASVTVFGGAGEVVLTSQLFAEPATRTLSLFANGAQAEVRDLRVWRLTPVR